MKVIGVIPARYQSTRFPGKPLVDICGKPMIWWVYQQCMKVSDFESVYVATDDNRIYSVCNELNMRVLMTSDKHRTGTDRVGEVAEKIPADLYVNIQGDEPLIEPETIQAATKPFYGNSDFKITNLMTRIKEPVDIVNFTVPKVVTNKDGIGIYLTRATAPYPQGSINYGYYKQVCVYGFKPEALSFFCEYGKNMVRQKMRGLKILKYCDS